MPSSQEIARVMAEMDRFNKSVTVTEERYEKRVASVGGSYGGLTALLQQGAPGNWASDHKSEAEKFSGWHYVAITSIGKAVRSSDVEAYQEKVREYAKGYNEQDEDTTPLPKWHPLMKLLKRPNPSQSGASFREEMAIQLCLTGSALVWNVPNQMGRTVERYVIPTAIAEPRQPEKGLPKGGWYINPEVARWQIESGWFLYTGLATAIGKVIDARDVQVVRFIHPVFKDEGQSPVSAGALWTDTSEKIDISRHAHLRNGSDPSVIIGIDGVEDEGTLQRMSAKFNEKYAGPSKHGKAMFVNGQNVKVEPVTRTPAEMAYEGAFAQFRDAIMALHGVTPIAAGIEAPSGDDGLYAPLKQFVVGTVQPILDLMAEEDTEQLASQFGEGVSILYTARAIDDAKLTEQQINTDIAAGAIEVDEIRKLRGRKPWGGEKGKSVAGQGAKEEPQQGLPGLAQGVPGLEPQTGSQALDPSKPPQGTPDPMKLAEEAVAKALGGFADRLSALLKSGDNCGTGAGGFKPGNDCARGGVDGSDAPEKKKRGKKAGKSEPKEFWEMTPSEFRRANNQSLVDALTDTESYGPMRYVKPGELRVGESGELEIKRVPPGGKLKDKPTWNRLNDKEEEYLRKKLGVESRDHEGEIEQAIQSGKPVPKEVAEYFPKNDLIYEHFSSKPSSSTGRANETRGSGNKFTELIDAGKERDITEEVLDYVNSIHKLPASDRDDLASDLFDKLPILRSDYDKLTEEAANIDPKYGKWMASRVELQRERDRESDAAREAYLQELRDSVNKPKRPTRKKSFFKSSDCGANAEGGGGFQPGNTCGREDGSGESGGEKEKPKKARKVPEAVDGLNPKSSRFVEDIKERAKEIQFGEVEVNDEKVYEKLSEASWEAFSDSGAESEAVDEAKRELTSGFKDLIENAETDNGLPYEVAQRSREVFSQMLDNGYYTDAYELESDLNAAIDDIEENIKKGDVSWDDEGFVSDLRSQAKDAAREYERSIESYRESWVQDWENENYDTIRQQVADESYGEQGFELNTWYSSNKESNLEFETNSGARYKLTIDDDPSEISRLLPRGAKVGDLVFTDEEGSIRITGDQASKDNPGGRGEQMQVFRGVSSAVLAKLEHDDYDGLSYTAIEESRQELYDKLTVTVAQASPKYVAAVIGGYQGDHKGHAEYFVVKREHKDKLEAALRERAGDRPFNWLVKRYSGGVAKSHRDARGWVVLLDFFKSGSSCGANAQGGGGFQPGNTCGKRDGKGSESSEGGGKGAGVNPKILAWAREKFGDDATAENFAKWFGDSKVVDEEGNPLVVYRGDKNEINDFSDTGKRREVGIFTTPDKSVADIYGNGKSKPLYVSAERFLDLTIESREVEDFVNEWGRGSFDEWVDRETGERVEPIEVLRSGRMFDYEGDWSAERWLDLQATVKAAGYQAVKLPDYGNDGPFESIVVFSPTQIKSATGNSGTFDPKDPNITKSGSGCGANAEGGGGFQRGNTCGSREGGDSEGSGGSKPGKGGKVYEWALKKFKDEETARNFTKWFGDSKVVDGDGNPLIVYHGSPNGQFREFELDKAGERTDYGNLGIGIYTTPSKFVAEAYAGRTGDVMPLYLKSENPITIVYDEDFKANVESFAEKLGVKSKPVWKDQGVSNKEFAQEFASKALKAGYDGAFTVNTDGTIVEAICYSPEQVKSARKNSGKFNPKSRDITKSSDCGANGPGGGGFQPGNTCGKEDGAGEAQGEAGKAKPQGAFAKAREAAKADLERIRGEVIKTAGEWAAKIDEAKKVADAEFDKIAGATEPMEKAWKNIKGKTGEEKAEALKLYEAEAAKFDLLRGPANEAQARYRKMQEEARIAVAAVIGKESLALSESLGITDKHEQSMEENSRLHYSLLGVVAEEAKVLKDPSAMKSVTSGRAREARIAATEFLDSMLHPAIHQSALHSEIVYMEHGERASARPVRRGWNEAKQSEDDNKTGFSSIPLDATSSTYIHEYGHQVEFGSQEIRDLTLDFLASRTQGEEIVSLKEKYPDTNYDEWERGAKDGFAKAHEAAGFAPEDAESKAYYAGKSYGTRLTELLPMGLELMHKDAAAFAKADPEWFDLVAGIATGRLLPIAQKRLKDGK